MSNKLRRAFAVLIMAACAVLSGAAARAEQAWTDGGVAGTVPKYAAGGSTITASSIYDSGSGVTVASSVTVTGDNGILATKAILSDRLGIGTTAPGAKLHLSSGAAILDGTYPRFIIGADIPNLPSGRTPLAINTNAADLDGEYAINIRNLGYWSNGIMIDVMNGRGLQVNSNGERSDSTAVGVWAHNSIGIDVSAGPNANPVAYYQATVNPQLGGNGPVFYARHFTNYFSSDVFKAEMGMDGSAFTGNFLNFRNLHAARMLVSPTGYLWSASSATFGGGLKVEDSATGIDSAGDVNIGAGHFYKIGGASIDATGTLSNVAYKGQDNNFSAAQTFQYNISATTVAATTAFVYRDNSAQSTAANPYNFIINGAMDIWQRGISWSNFASRTYTADRFWVLIDGGGDASTYAGQGSFAPASEISKGLYVIRANGDTNQNYRYVGQTIESYNVRKFRGKTVTLSLYTTTALPESNFNTGGSGGLHLYVRSGTGSDEGAYPAAWTGTAVLVNQVVNKNGRNVVTFSVPSDANELEAFLFWRPDPTPASSGSDYIYTSGWQLEIGNTASPFGARDIGTEIELCQRYYEKSYDLEIAPGSMSSNGEAIWGAYGAATNWASISFKTRKRKAAGTCTVYANVGAANVVRDESSASNIAASIDVISQAGARIYYVVGGAQDHIISAQWACDAEL